MRLFLVFHTAELAPPTRWHVRINLHDWLVSVLFGDEDADLLVSVLLADEDADFLLNWPPLSELDMVIRRWWREANAGAGAWDYVQSSLYAADPGKLRGPSILPKFPTFRGNAVPLAGGAVFLRSPDGIPSALSLMLGLVLASVTRHPDAPPTCGLLMLAAGLGYGREAPGDHACSPMRLHQTSVGSCP
jgi:hypothetical protein